MENLSSEELELKLEDLEDGMEAMKEFVMNRLKMFEDRLTEVEKREAARSEISAVRQELESFTSGISLASSPVSSPSTFVRMTMRNPFRIEPSAPAKVPPEELDDVQDPQLRSELERYMPAELDLKERLNKVQLAFFLHWVEKHGVKGRKEEARRLESDGTRSNIWVTGKIEEGKRNFGDYLYEKLRGYVRKVRRGEKRKELEETYEISKEVLKY